MGTNVEFRKFPDGELIAIFPDIIWDNNGNLSSYMHIGQHGACHPDLLTELEEASMEEYMPLFKELKYLVGYDDLCPPLTFKDNESN